MSRDESPPLRPAPGPRALDITIYVAAAVVFGICFYAFLLGSEILDSDFKSDPIAWYFLAKGVFCSLSLILSVRVLRAVERLFRATPS